MSSNKKGSLVGSPPERNKQQAVSSPPSAGQLVESKMSGHMTQMYQKLKKSKHQSEIMKEQIEKENNKGRWLSEKFKLIDFFG